MRLSAETHICRNIVLAFLSFYPLPIYLLEHSGGVKFEFKAT